MLEKFRETIQPRITGRTITQCAVNGLRYTRVAADPPTQAAAWLDGLVSGVGVFFAPRFSLDN